MTDGQTKYSRMTALFGRYPAMGSAGQPVTAGDRSA